MHLAHLCLLGLLGSAQAAPAARDADQSSQPAIYSTAASLTFSDSSDPASTPEAHLQRPPLLPAVRLDKPRGDIEDLAPRTKHDLYFSSHGVNDPKLKHAFADFSATWTMGVVVLDQSSWIENITCVDGDVKHRVCGELSGSGDMHVEQGCKAGFFVADIDLQGGPPQAPGKRSQGVAFRA